MYQICYHGIVLVTEPRYVQSPHRAQTQHSIGTPGVESLARPNARTPSNTTVLSTGISTGCFPTRSRSSTACLGSLLLLLSHWTSDSCDVSGRTNSRMLHTAGSRCQIRVRVQMHAVQTRIQDSVCDVDRDVGCDVGWCYRSEDPRSERCWRWFSD